MNANSIKNACHFGLDNFYVVQLWHVYHSTVWGVGWGQQGLVEGGVTDAKENPYSWEEICLAAAELHDDPNQITYKLAHTNLVYLWVLVGSPYGPYRATEVLLDNSITDLPNDFVQHMVHVPFSFVHARLGTRLGLSICRGWSLGSSL